MQLFSRLFAAILIAVLSLIPAFPVAAHSVPHPIELTGAFARATLPGAKVGGGYVTITSKAHEADRLISATSTAAQKVELHEMKMEGDVMKMQALENGIEIPAEGTVILAPGGLHIMFMGLNAPFTEGSEIPVTLTFEKAGAIDVLLKVEGVAADAPAHTMGM